MECTQRLECTQELYSAQSEKECPEQIGFLGICGKKYPILMGPNKVGRDPQTCNVVLNLNSISRQHAVINILNSTEFMIMDLDAANKTKLLGKTLQPYIPQPLQNGDVVHFGDVFGIFRLLEECDELPITQAIDNFDTPIVNRQMSRLNVPVKTIPESPDLSDKDDSFIVSSQSNKRSAEFKNAHGHFIKTSGKIVALQPIGSNKIDNIYWKSSKKSHSFNTSENLNDSSKCYKAPIEDNNIHEMETQLACKETIDSKDSIYTTETQIPASAQVIDNDIYDANTQLPGEMIPSMSITNMQTSSPLHNKNIHVPAAPSQSIHSQDTQIPGFVEEQLPNVCKIENQHKIQIKIKAENTSVDAGAQIIDDKKTNISTDSNSTNKESSEFIKKSSDNITQKNPDESNEIILFDGIESQHIDAEFESQALLLSQISPAKCLPETTESQRYSGKNERAIRKVDDCISGKRWAQDSDSSTDCEDIDILPTQKIPPETIQNDIDILATQVIPKYKDDDCDIDTLPTQVITKEIDDNNEVCFIHNNKSYNKDSNINIEEMETQIIEDDVIILDHRKIIKKCNDKQDDNIDINLEPTQIIDEATNSNIVSPKREIFEDIVSPFKIPLQSPIKIKKKNMLKLAMHRPPTPQVQKEQLPIIENVDNNYYEATQEIFNDLCSQIESLPEAVKFDKEKTLNNNNLKNFPKESEDDDFLPCSAENYEVGSRFPGLEDSPSQKTILDTSFQAVDNDERNINDYVTNLSNQQIQEIVGTKYVENLKRQPSDVSDVETTPKKVQMKFLDMDLPSSQEIKSTVTLNSRSVITESSSDSENETESENSIPILFQEKKKGKRKNVKVDLTEIFQTETLPTRVITRVRKPTIRAQNYEQTSSILKSRFLTEQEENIDNEIIMENVFRLRNKIDKKKNFRDTTNTLGKSTANKTEECKLKHDIDLATKGSKNKESKGKEITFKRSKSKRNQSLNSNTNDRKKITCKKIEEYLVREGNSQDLLASEKKIKTSSKIKDNGDSCLKIEETLTVASEENKTLRSTRRTRSKKNNSDDKEYEKSESESKEQKTEKTGYQKQSEKVNIKSRSRKTPTIKLVERKRSSISPEVVPKSKPSTKNDEESSVEANISLRRSTRRQKTREINENINNNKDLITGCDSKPTTRRSRRAENEQSRVYDTSSEIGVGLPRLLKRSAASDISGAPNPKRKKSPRSNSVKSSNSSKLTSVRNQHILFTAFSNDEIKNKLIELGAVIVTEIEACTVLVTLQIKRTFKLLCTVGLGRPIVGLEWVQACIDNEVIVDPWSYLLKDDTAEKRFRFSLEKTLTGKRNFLKGYCVSSTPNVLPNASEMKLIVECSGGEWKEEGSHWVCVTCLKDKPLWPSYRRRGAILVTTEFILGGVLRQQVDIEQNKL